MKNLKICSIASVAALTIIVSACNMKNDLSKDLTAGVVGTYIGTLTTDNLKVTSDATAVVTKSGDNELEIHCYGDEIDTTFIQHLFEDGNMIQMCSTGDDFLNEYGHNMMDQSQHHNMMNDNNGISWAHHMDKEHDEDDEHYGNFDITTHAFNYTFNMESNDVSYSAQFSGTRE